MTRWLCALTLASILQASAIHEKLKPCPNTPTDLCGTHEVFENRATRQGRRIALNIVVLPSLTQPALPDPLAVLVGGPGQAATEGAAGERRRFSQILAQRGRKYCKEMASPAGFEPALSP